MLKPYSPAHHPALPPKKKNKHQQKAVQSTRTNSSTRWTGQTRVDNRQPMKAGCWDNPLTLRVSAVSNLHKQHSPIVARKISHCLPQLEITKSKKSLPQIPLTPALHFQGTSFFSSLRKILRRTFPSLGTRFIYFIYFI